jgi:Outer membrane protein beta-barrel family/TonB-dependent Receptor Plug Domain
VNYTLKHFSITCFCTVFISVFLIAQRPDNPSGSVPGAGGNRPKFNPEWAQAGRFYGKIVDAQTGKPVEYATLRLFGMRWDSVARAPKEMIVGGQLTGENGEFSLDKLPVIGDFRLEINALGYESSIQTITFGFKRGEGRPDPSKFDKDLGNLKLSVSSVLLKETEIVGQAAGFQLALDKKVFRMDKNLNAAGGTAEDALRNVPSLSVDVDGNITLRNSSPQIFVDGRPTNLTLEQIPADAIDNVELITNPSAKYDASGGAGGIVNIVLKKERRIGYSGNVRAGIDMRGRPNIGLDLNAREGKVNGFVSGNLFTRRSLSEGETDRNNFFGPRPTYVFQANNSENNRVFANGRAGLDWLMNNRNTLTLAGNLTQGQFKTNDRQNITTDTLLNDNLLHRSEALRTTAGERQFRNFGGQVLFKHLFPKEGKEWTADVNYNSARFDNFSDFSTEYFDSDQPGLQSQTGEGFNNFLTLQTDFVTPLRNGIKVEAGARAAIRDYSSKNANFQYNYQSQSTERVPNFADEYSFNDQVYAAYSTFSHSFKKWGYQLGLRAESSQYEGRLPLSNDGTFGNQYPISLFPSVFTTYKINEEDNLQLNLTRRINRPSFFQLIPFPDFSDSLLLSRGNPELRPEFTNAMEFSYLETINRNNNFLASAYFRYSTDLITRYQFKEFNTFLGRDAVVNSYINAQSGYAYGAEITIKNTIFKIVDLVTNVNFYNSVLNAENVEAGLDNQQFTWLVKENVTLRLPFEFVLQLTGEYQSRTALSNFSGGGGGPRGHGGGGGWGEGPSNSVQGYRIPVGFMDISLRKSFWKRNGSVTLSFNDIFRSQINGSYTENAAFIQETWRLRDPQFVRLNFSYRFGKFDQSLFRRKNTRTSSEGMEF